MLLPPSCPVCGALGAAPCPSCAALLEPAPPLPTPGGVEACWSLLAYEGAGRELVARLKYRGNRSPLGGLAAAMASIVPAHWGRPVVTWAPTTRARRLARGFDHAELLAVAVARHLATPSRRLLVRGAGPGQTGRSGAARRSSGPVFRVRRPVPPLVLVVDDVVTTGATLAAAAAALRAGGAHTVLGLTAAATPAPAGGADVVAPSSQAAAQA